MKWGKYVLDYILLGYLIIFILTLIFGIVASIYIFHISKIIIECYPNIKKSINNNKIFGIMWGSVQYILLFNQSWVLRKKEIEFTKEYKTLISNPNFKTARLFFCIYLFLLAVLILIPLLILLIGVC